MWQCIPLDGKVRLLAVFHSMSNCRLFFLESHGCTLGTMAYLPGYTYSNGRWFSSLSIDFTVSYTVFEIVNITVNLTGSRIASALFWEGVSTLS